MRTSVRHIGPDVGEPELPRRASSRSGMAWESADEKGPPKSLRTTSTFRLYKSVDGSDPSEDATEALETLIAQLTANINDEEAVLKGTTVLSQIAAKANSAHTGRSFTTGTAHHNFTDPKTAEHRSKLSANAQIGRLNGLDPCECCSMGREGAP